MRKRNLCVVDIINKIVNRLKKPQKIRDLEYIFLLGGPREAWVQGEASLAFFDDRVPIVWTKHDKMRVLKSGKDRICDILSEKQIDEKRADLVIAETGFCPSSATIKTNKQREKVLKRSKETTWHFIEMKFAELNWNPRNKSLEKCLKKNLFADFEKLKELKRKGQIAKVSSVVAMCFLRIYSADKVDPKVVEDIIRTEKIIAIQKTERVIYLGHDDSILYYLISVWE